MKTAMVLRMTVPTSRYNSMAIAKEVQRVRTKKGLNVKTFGVQAGITHWSVYKKESGEVPYSVEELGRIAELFDAPTGWPFISWKDGEAFDRR